MSEPEWKTFEKGNLTCSIRGCDRASTKRLDLITAGYVGFGNFGKKRVAFGCEFRKPRIQSV